MVYKRASACERQSEEARNDNESNCDKYNDEPNQIYVTEFVWSTKVEPQVCSLCSRLEKIVKVKLSLILLLLSVTRDSTRCLRVATLNCLTQFSL